MLVEGSTTKGISSIEKIESSNNSGFMILHIKPSVHMEDMTRPQMVYQLESGNFPC